MKMGKVAQNYGVNKHSDVDLLLPIPRCMVLIAIEDKFCLSPELALP